MPRDNKGKIKGKKSSKYYVLDLGNELLQCEFTNELRTYREKIQIICNHIAVEIRPCFLFRLGSIQSAVGHISERLFCAFTDAGGVLLAVSIADLIFRPENTVSTNACNRIHYTVFRYDNEHLRFCVLQ